MSRRWPLRSYCAALALVFAVLAAPASGQTGPVDIPVAGGQQLKLGKFAVNKVLFLGNSITLHGPAVGVWDGNWGMAASAADKDYVHLLAAKIAEAAGGEPKILVRNIADFERHHDAYDLAAGLSEPLGFGPDLIIVAIGENVPTLANDADKTKFAAAFDRLLAEIKRHGQPAVVVRSCFWADAAKDSIMRQASQTAGAIFVDISKLGGEEVNYARSERAIEHVGVARHPGDRGMQAIADALWLAIQRESQAH